MNINKLAYVLQPRLNDLSPVYGAILGFVLNQNYTEPQLHTLSITSDGFMISGDYFFWSI